jgi:hypothetical protein
MSTAFSLEVQLALQALDRADRVTRCAARARCGPTAPDLGEGLAAPRASFHLADLGGSTATTPLTPSSWVSDTDSPTGSDGWWRLTTISARARGAPPSVRARTRAADQARGERWAHGLPTVTERANAQHLLGRRLR